MAPEPAVIESRTERFVYMVASHSKPGRRYRVDITANNGGMECHCKDFVTRRQPAIDRGEPLLTRATTCRHTRAAMRHFWLKLIPKLETQ